MAAISAVAVVQCQKLKEVFGRIDGFHGNRPRSGGVPFNPEFLSARGFYPVWIEAWSGSAFVEIALPDWKRKTMTDLAAAYTHSNPNVRHG